MSDSDQRLQAVADVSPAQWLVEAAADREGPADGADEINPPPGR